MHAPPRAVRYKMYLAASAITTTVKVTNAIATIHYDVICKASTF